MAKSVMQPEPMRGYNFRLEVDGYTGYFVRCSGLGVRVQPLPWREGGAGAQVRQLVGPLECAEVTLSYGVIPSVHTGLWSWLESAMSGLPTRKSTSVIFLDTQGSETMRFNLYECWPTRWCAAELDALAREVAVESLTLVFERLEKG